MKQGLKYVLIFVLFILVGCKKTDFNASIVEELTYFDTIELNDSFDLILAEGNEFAIKITGDAQLIEDVVFEIENSTLKISNERSLKWLTPTKNKITLTITSHPLKLVKANQTCYISTQTPITSEEFGLEFHSKANEANLELNGNVFYYWNNFQCGGKLTLSGQVNFLKIWNFAAVSVDAKDLLAKEAIIENSSLGDCKVYVSEKIDYLIRGIGNIYLLGNPPIINKTLETDAEGKLIVF